MYKIMRTRTGEAYHIVDLTKPKKALCGKDVSEGYDLEIPLEQALVSAYTCTRCIRTYRKLENVS